MRPIYLDNNATTQPTPNAVAAATRGLTELWQNPSSVHRPGQEARHAFELARAELAGLIGVPPRRLTLTGSGSESITLAIRGILATSHKRTLITTDVEHAAIRDLCEQLEQDGMTVKRIPLLKGGVADVTTLETLIDDDTALVSAQWANNENGAIQPIDAIGQICRARGVAFHTDATQWVGKMPCNLVAPDAPPIDMLTFSAHKFHGPKGVGGLWTGANIRLRPLMPGSQELGRRGGTENLSGVLGAGAAARDALEWLDDEQDRNRLRTMRGAFEQSVLDRCPGAIVNGPADLAQRLWNTTNIAFPRLEAEALLMGFSERGLCASAGAACSSGSLDPSPVLLSMGVPPHLAHGSVRFSLSRNTTQDELDQAASIIEAVVARLSTMLP
ncbi:MAG: cysteine desulfurase family protein [Phycisphaerales bacterium]